MKKLTATSILLVALTSAAPVAAQDAPSQAPAPAPAEVPRVQAAPAKPAVNMDDMRHHIYVMEGALAAADNLGRQPQQPKALTSSLHSPLGEAGPRG